MYDVFVSVINKGGYKLDEMLERIKVYAAEGKLTISEMEVLEKLAREKASVKGDTDVFAKLEDLERRVRALEEKNATEEEPPTDENGDTIIPEYVAGKWYYKGDLVTWDGETYVCIAPDGVTCVWSPADYPAYWQKLA